jgi:hypothetical protein
LPSVKKDPWLTRRRDVKTTHSSADCSTIAVAGVVVSRVELIADKSGSPTADILDLGQLRILNNSTSRVPRVGSDDDTSSSGNLLLDLLGVDMISVFLRQRNRNSSELADLVSLPRSFMSRDTAIGLSILHS